MSIKIPKQFYSGQAGFSILEIAISLGLMLMIAVVASQVMRDGVDLRTALSQKARVTHRLQTAMDRLAKDLSHAFIISNTDTERNAIGRRQKGIFKLEKSGSDKLMFTTFSNRPFAAGVKASDSVYVVYELKDDKEVSGRKSLFRGATTLIPEDFKDDPPLKLLAKHIKNFVVEPYNGDDWSKDRWDNTRSDWRNMIPHMVRITIEAYSQDRTAEDTDPALDEATEILSTVVYLQRAEGTEEPKSSTATIKWDRL